MEWQKEFDEKFRGFISIGDTEGGYEARQYIKDFISQVHAAAVEEGAENERQWILENCSGGGDWRRKIMMRSRP